MSVGTFVRLQLAEYSAVVIICDRDSFAIDSDPRDEFKISPGGKIAIFTDNKLNGHLHQPILT